MSLSSSSVELLITSITGCCHSTIGLRNRDDFIIWFILVVLVFTSCFAFIYCSYLLTLLYQIL